MYQQAMNYGYDYDSVCILLYNYSQIRLRNTLPKFKFISQDMSLF